MTDELVTLAVSDGIARLTLNRPEAGNALNPPLAAALREHASQLAGRPGLRVVVFGAAGKAFCVGGDLGFMAGAGDDVGPAVTALAEDVHAAMLTLAELDAPVIAAVQGVAAGGGLGLVAGADLAVAAASARFTMAYTAAGLSPDCGTTWFLPRAIGMRRTAELALTNRRLDADEALALGLLTRVVPDGELDAAVDELAARLAAGATHAFGAVGRLLRDGERATLAEQLEAEAHHIGALAATADGREGVAAFLEKRPPVFGA